MSSEKTVSVSVITVVGPVSASSGTGKAYKTVSAQYGASNVNRTGDSDRLSCYAIRVTYFRRFERSCALENC
jgi:hypothetical protein